LLDAATEEALPVNQVAFELCPQSFRVAEKLAMKGEAQLAARWSIAGVAFSVNCPVALPSRYLGTEDEKHFYRCPHHGTLILPPGGHVRGG
jgi:hypothetical protein